MASAPDFLRAARLRGAALSSRLIHSRGWAHALGLLIFLGALIAAEFTFSLLQRELDARARADALRFASALRAGLERELNSVLYLSSGLGSYLAVRSDSLDDGEVQAILADLYGDAQHVRNFGVAIGYRLTYVYPLLGNESAIGMSYPDQPGQWPAVQRAVASNRGTLAGPLRLVQGGEGLIYRMPVRIHGEYWGLLSTVIDSGSLLSAATADLREEPYAFAIRGRDGLGAQGAVFAGDPQLFVGDAVTLEANVPNGHWVLAVQPREAAATSAFAVALRLMGWGLALLLGIAATGLLNHRVDLAQLALFDPLTALPNRRHFEDNLAQLLERTPRGGRVCGVLFIDLDGFKAINDTFGHKAGDFLLKTIGDRVSQMVRSHDTVARWGGDELVVVADDTDLNQLLMLAERLRGAIEVPVDYDGCALRVGASIGHALPPQDGTSPRELLKVADQRMYEQKQQRKRAAV